MRTGAKQTGHRPVATSARDGTCIRSHGSVSHPGFTLDRRRLTAHRAVATRKPLATVLEIEPTPVATALWAVEGLSVSRFPLTAHRAVATTQRLQGRYKFMRDRCKRSDLDKAILLLI